MRTSYAQQLWVSDQSLGDLWFFGPVKPGEWCISSSYQIMYPAILSALPLLGHQDPIRE